MLLHYLDKDTFLTDVKSVTEIQQSVCYKGHNVLPEDGEGTSDASVQCECTCNIWYYWKCCDFEPDKYTNSNKKWICVDCVNH